MEKKADEFLANDILHNE